MQHIFGSLLFEKYAAKGNCIRHGKFSQAKRGADGCVEVPQGSFCEACKCVVKEDTDSEVEYVSASYLQGKYVLLYLTDPINVSATTAALPQHCLTHSSPMTGFSFSSVTSVFGCSSSVGGVNGLVHTRSPSSGMSDFQGKKSERITSLLSTFYGLLIGQLTTKTSLSSGKAVFPITVLEVRQPGDSDNLSPFCGARKGQHSVAAKTPAADVARDVSSPAPGKGAAEVASSEVKRLLLASEFAPETTAITSNPLFAGWLVLETLTAYRQIIQMFNVTSWPSVLLFGPDGSLLTIRALDHIRREMNFYVGDACSSLLLAGGNAEQQRPRSEFHSDFPWGTEELGDDEGTKTEKSAGAVPVSTLLRRLILSSRRVEDVLDDKGFVQSEPMTDQEEHAQWDKCLSGATHLLLYFGGGWHPSSKRFLPQLRHLWFRFNNFPDKNDTTTDTDIGRHEGLGCCYAEGKSLGTFAFTATSFSAVRTMSSCPLGTSIEPHDFVNEEHFDDTCNLSLTEGSVTAQRIVSDNKGLGSFSSVVKSTSESILKKTTPTSMDDCVNVRPSLGQQPVCLQVIYLSCDVDKSQLSSVLSTMPLSWLCISSLFGSRQAKLIEASMEMFGVSVFPRLVVSALICEPESSEVVGEMTSSVRRPSNTTFHVVQFHAEEAVFRDDVKKLLGTGEKSLGLPRLPFRGFACQESLLRGNCCSAMRSVFSEGGCLFVLCGVGKVPAGLHRVCASVLQKASLWWSQEMVSFARRLEDCWASSAEVGSSVFSSCCVYAERLKNCLLLDADDTKDSATEPMAAELFLAATRKKAALCLPVYFCDAVEETEEGSDNGEADVLRGADSDTTLDDRSKKEERYLLQEFVLSEVLGNEQLLPPVKGEPFLVCVQWPERRVAVLRRKFEFEISTAAGPATCARPPCAVSTFAPCSTNNFSPTCAPPADGRQAEGVASPEPSTGPQIPSSSELYSSNPLCSVPHVRAFIAQHALGQCASRQIC